MKNDPYLAHRLFLTEAMRRQFDFSTTGQKRGLPRPPLQKPYNEDALRIKLTTHDTWPASFWQMTLPDAIARRESRRNYTAEGLDLNELSFLLWATQGVRRMRSRNTALRTVPSAGARHSFETYLFIFNVTGISPALYRYLPLSHEIVHIRSIQNMASAVVRAAGGQKFMGAGAVTFVWSCIPYRMEWRYGLTAHRMILMDVGHVCQNLYLVCEAIDSGTCAVAAYNQHEMDKLIGLDGKNECDEYDEFAVYAASVGKVAPETQSK